MVSIHSFSNIEGMEVQSMYLMITNTYFFLIFTKNTIVEFEMALSCGFRGNEFKKHLEMLK